MNRIVPPHTFEVGPWAALVPFAAFLLSLTVAEWDDQGLGGSLFGLLIGVVIYLPFVAGPCLLALVAARRSWLKAAAVVVMTATAVFAGVSMGISDDGQAGLAVLWVPFVAFPLAALIWIGEAVVLNMGWRETGRPMARSYEPAVADVADRLRALAVDAVLVGAVLCVPLTAMSHAGREIVAVAAGVVVAAAYFGTAVAWRGRTVGQFLVGLSVVDAGTLGRVPVTRSFDRGLIIVVEVAAGATFILAPPAVVELVVVINSGRSVTDRVTRTTVLGRPSSGA